MNHQPGNRQIDRPVSAIRLVMLLLLMPSCQQMVERTDRDVAAVIAERQREALGADVPVAIPADGDLSAAPPATAYSSSPNPVSPEIPVGFEPVPAQPGTPSTQPVAAASQPVASTHPATAPTQPVRIFTLTDALAYAQRNQRDYQTAKEDLYLSALALTLERHLWTPVFASNLRTVYGNFGEITDFDQAMRFVADLSISQRLPYGGEFTAQAVSTLIRDVGKTITAEEGSVIELGVRVPFLRGAGHVAREDLIQLERELTYSVRVFERFRRSQLVDVASAYFDLSRSKQVVTDTEASVRRRAKMYEQASDFQRAGLGTPLESQRAEFDYLSAQNNLEIARENFRAQADRFKLLIGMPVEQPLGFDDLESIEDLETQIATGEYPALVQPTAVADEQLALQTALGNRLDLLNRRDRIDDARRGVAIAKNALLPDLDLTSSVTWDTDPNHYRLGDFSFDRTTWRSELVLGLPLERTSERNQYRRALIDVRQAQRNHQDWQERIRAEVRSAVNQIVLQDRSVEIQRRNLAVADKRLEYAHIQYYEYGKIPVRDLSDAEDAWENARSRLNRAKTEAWIAVLDFRLATETLRIDETGVQHPMPEVPQSPPVAPELPAETPPGSPNLRQ